MKDIKVVVKKMTRNRRKVIGKPGDSLLCRLHSIQLSALVYSFLYGSDSTFDCFTPQRRYDLSVFRPANSLDILVLSESTGRKTDKTHLCALCDFTEFCDAALMQEWHFSFCSARAHS